MSNDSKIRWGWLKFMYFYTIVGAGAFGLGMLVIPNQLRTIFGWPDQDPITFGICGSVYLAFALLSIHGLKSPLKFSPILLLQLVYKVIWFIGVIIPILIAGNFPSHAILLVIIFASYIIGDLIAIPFSYLFAKKSDQPV
ncbi:hypothetical protein ACFLT2_02150 [Acidobacteriota bacterium]